MKMTNLNQGERDLIRTVAVKGQPQLEGPGPKAFKSEFTVCSQDHLHPL